MADKDTPKAPQDGDGNDDDGSLLGQLRRRGSPPPTAKAETPLGASDNAAPKGKAPPPVFKGPPPAQPTPFKPPPPAVAKPGASLPRDHSTFTPAGVAPYVVRKPIMAPGFLDCEGFYTIMELPSPKFPDEMLRNQFQRMAKRLHPDKNRDDPHANSKFALLFEPNNLLLSKVIVNLIKTIHN